MALVSTLRWWWAVVAQLLRGMLGARPALPATSPASVDPPSIEEREATAGAARCIACGTCDRHFDAWADVPRDRFFGPMTFVLRARAPSAWPALGPMTLAMERAKLDQLTARCPAHVPFVSLVRVVRAKVPPPAPRPPRKSKVVHDPG